ncbi:MAG: hypothetical protein ACP5LW_01100 [Nitrososphaeria archaeon]
MSNRKRGYDWEDKIVKTFRRMGWNAVRLGSPSVHLPDVLAINNAEKRIVAIEAKASRGERIRVPQREIERLFDFLELFQAYERREAVIAIKFLKVRGKSLSESFYEVRCRSPGNIGIRRGESPDNRCLAPWRVKRA